MNFLLLIGGSVVVSGSVFMVLFYFVLGLDVVVGDTAQYPDSSGPSLPFFRTGRQVQ